MMSSNSGGKPGGRKPARLNGVELSPFDDFLADIVDLASSIDGQLASILSNGAARPAPRLPWTGNKQQGLELCLNMLRYAREEDTADEDLVVRLDAAIDYAEAELQRSGARSLLN